MDTLVVAAPGRFLVAAPAEELKPGIGREKNLDAAGDKVGSIGARISPAGVMGYAGQGRAELYEDLGIVAGLESRIAAAGISPQNSIIRRAKFEGRYAGNTDGPRLDKKAGATNSKGGTTAKGNPPGIDLLDAASIEIEHGKPETKWGAIKIEVEEACPPAEPRRLAVPEPGACGPKNERKKAVGRGVWNEQRNGDAPFGDKKELPRVGIREPVKPDADHLRGCIGRILLRAGRPPERSNEYQQEDVRQAAEYVGPVDIHGR